MRILTSVKPRHWGDTWKAWDDQTYYYLGDPLGIGATEQEAIEDLMDQLKERERA